MSTTSDTDILDFIAARQSDLSPAEAAIAAVVLREPGRVVDSTIAQLAAASGSAEATVTRFCRSLGLSGYPQLRMKLAVAVERSSSETRGSGFAMLDEIEPGESVTQIAAKVGAANARAAQLTAQQLDADDLVEAVHRLAVAERVVALGVGSSALAAQDAARKLQFLGRFATATSDVHEALMLTAHHRSADVMLVFSHSGRTREVVDIIAHAVEQGIFTILVTNLEHSPAARRADLVLRTSAQETAFRSGGIASRIAQLTVVDVLFVALSHAEEARTTEAAERMHDAVSTHVVAEDGDE